MIKELQQLSAAIMRECQNVLRQIDQYAFDGMIGKEGEHSLSVE